MAFGSFPGDHASMMRCHHINSFKIILLRTVESQWRQLQAETSVHVQKLFAVRLITGAGRWIDGTRNPRTLTAHFGRSWRLLLTS
jgi:hypothetical protein